MTLGRSAHDNAVSMITQFEPLDDEQDQHRQDVVAYLRTHADALHRDCRPDHVTASALVLSKDGQRVLLDLHRKVRMWLQFGGHVEAADGDLAETALREAREESGIAQLSLWSPQPVRIDVHPAPCGARNHLDVQFVAWCDPDLDPSPSAESHDVRWFDVDALPQPTDAAVEALVATGVRCLAQ